MPLIVLLNTSIDLAKLMVADIIVVRFVVKPLQILQIRFCSELEKKTNGLLLLNVCLKDIPYENQRLFKKAIALRSIKNKEYKAVNEFYKALTYINKIFYEPNHLTINAIREEAQNSDYGAGMFQLNSKSVRFRVAKITPNKIGQFVAFWEKDGDNKNQAFSYEKATDLLVINTFTSNNNFGQFVFPREVLVKQNILKTATTKGKMAIRVYPRWENLTSKQAIETQKWQLAYFVEVNNTNSFPVQKLLKLYSN